MITEKLTNLILSHSKKLNFTNSQRAHVRDIIDGFVAQDAPITIVFPAFHGKVPNCGYVTGHLPDFGDYLGVQVLAQLAESVRSIYSPGVQIFVLHEGHLYTDTPLVGSPDDVSDYLSAIRGIFAPYDYLHSLSALDLLGEGITPEEALTNFVECYTQSITDVDEVRALQGPYLDLYRAYKTMYTEILLSQHDITKAQARRQSRCHALTQISRYIGYGKLVREHFEGQKFLKFTVINKKDEDSRDIPMSYIPNKCANGTPLLNATCLDEDYHFVKARDAYAKGFVPIKSQGLDLFVRP